MAAPIYLQEQVSAMMATPKHVEHDEWQKRFEGRAGNDEERNRIKVYPNDEKDSTEFVVETCRCIARGEASFTLFGKLIGYTEHPLCRYEIQISPHRNPKWFPPTMFGSLVPHRHIYNERAIREDHSWDRCAEPLKELAVPKKGKKFSVQQWIDRIGPIFVKDVRLDVADPDADPLFGR